MTTHDPAAVISRVLAGVLIPGRPYPSPLPAELAAWHCYMVDGGHSILVALPADGPPTEDRLVPAPVKAVLRAGWTIADGGFIVCDLPYDPTLGLVAEPDDEEFDAGGHPSSHGTGHVVVVGRPYNPAITDWPDGIGQLRLTDHGAEFLLPLRKPAPHEVTAFRQGTAAFGLLPRNRFLVLLYRFADPRDSNPRHGLPWSDAVWEYHRQTLADPVAVPRVPGAPGTNILLHLIMVDAATGIVAGQRVLTAPHEFADALRAAVQRQQDTPSDPSQAMREIQDLYNRHTTTDLLPHAVRFETTPSSG